MIRNVFGYNTTSRDNSTFSYCYSLKNNNIASYPCVSFNNYIIKKELSSVTHIMVVIINTYIRSNSNTIFNRYIFTSRNNRISIDKNSIANRQRCAIPNSQNSILKDMSPSANLQS